MKYPEIKVEFEFRQTDLFVRSRVKSKEKTWGPSGTSFSLMDPDQTIGVPARITAGWRSRISKIRYSCVGPRYVDTSAPQRLGSTPWICDVADLSYLDPRRQSAPDTIEILEVFRATKSNTGVY